jgi:hypothetical protein
MFCFPTPGWKQRGRVHSANGNRLLNRGPPRQHGTCGQQRAGRPACRCIAGAERPRPRRSVARHRRRSCARCTRRHRKMLEIIQENLAINSTSVTFGAPAEVKDTGSRTRLQRDQERTCSANGIDIQPARRYGRKYRPSLHEIPITSRGRLKMSDTKISLKNLDELRAESARSRIVSAAITHLEHDRGIHLGSADAKISWSLDFTLHISL